MVIDDSELERLVALLTPADKAVLVNGATTWATAEVPLVGVRAIRMSDGPSGVRGASWDERRTAVGFPCGVALGATFDAALLTDVGRALGAQARERGIDVLLGPTINLQRTPTAGRHFEYLSEDPYLTSVLAVAYISGLQSQGVAASPKHFVANDFETERHTVDVQATEEVLRETVLLPFEAAVVDGRAWTIMVAYNAVNGTPMTENDSLLGTVLREQWGFDGVALSDWGAVKTTSRSAEAPLDLAMPGPAGPWGGPLRQAIAEGYLDGRILDQKVRNIVRLADRVGRLGKERPESEIPHSSSPSDIAREAAAASITMLTNDGTLPLRSGVLRVAVIGPNAVRPVTQGGGSAHVNALTREGPLEALRRALGPGVDVKAVAGCDTRQAVPPVGEDIATTDPRSGASGVRVDYRDAQGTVLTSEVRGSGRLVWFGDLPDDVNPAHVDSIAVHSRLDVAGIDALEVGIAAMSSQVLYADEELVLEADRSGIDGADLFHSPSEFRITLDTADRSWVDLSVFQPLYERRELAVCFLGARDAASDPDAEMQDAVRLAQQAEVSIVVVGTNSEVESEGYDRATLELPGRQNELVSRIAAVSRSTVVVVNAGAPVNMPWLGDVGAVLVNWFGGEWAGDALARVLVGEREPQGRLPFTWPQADAPDAETRTIPRDGVVTYSRPAEVANRRQEDSQGPLFFFGHGLGYTSWEVAGAEIVGHRDATGPLAFNDGVVRFRVSARNTGSRYGRTVIQVYAEFADEHRSRHRGSTAFIGMTVVSAEAGSTVTVHVDAPVRMTQRWDGESGQWVDRPVAAYRVGFAASGNALRLG